MAKLSRVIQKVFGSNAPANQVGKFGSLAAGDPQTTKDPTEIQSLPNYEGGWFSGVLGNNSPAIEDRNALDFLFSRQLAYLMQAGIPEWHHDATYYEGNFASHNGNIFVSLTNDNTGNDPTAEFTNWRLMSPYAPGDYKFTTASVPPFGFLSTNGGSYATADYPELFAVIGHTYGGIGDNFLVPNTQGRFFRATGGSAAPLGQSQEDSTKIPRAGFTTNLAGLHSHAFRIHGTREGSNYVQGTSGNPQRSVTTSTEGNHRHSISGGDTETRPKNITVNCFIKY